MAIIGHGNGIRDFSVLTLLCLKHPDVRCTTFWVVRMSGVYIFTTYLGFEKTQVQSAILIGPSIYPSTTNFIYSFP
jgi:hypothetical protein